MNVRVEIDDRDRGVLQARPRADRIQRAAQAGVEAMLSVPGITVPEVVSAVLTLAARQGATVLGMSPAGPGREADRERLRQGLQAVMLDLAREERPS
jgi:hypothetical protein